MMFSKETLQNRLSGLPVTTYCLLATALFTFLGMAFGPFGSYLFEEALVIPVVLFLYVCFTRPIPAGAKKALGLSLLMFGWFLVLQIVRDLLYFDVYPLGTYFCSYLFAFPLASLLQDGDKKQALKLFAGVFVAASLFHSLAALLLTLGLVPAYFTQYHLSWDGSRLNSFWHPNMVACFLMFGIASCVAFLQEAKKGWVKLALLAAIVVILATMALTNCRTIIILTAGILGGAVFYAILKGRWKMAPIAIVAALIVVMFVGSFWNLLYQLNSDRLLAQQAAAFAAEAASSAELESSCPQGSFSQDLFTLNSRTSIWQASILAMNASKIRYIFGVDNPGKHMSYFCWFEQTHTHNSWFETLMGLGLPGLFLAMVFTVMTLRNGIRILLKYPTDVWKRTIAMLCLCMLVASFMEPYLFLPPLDYYIFNFIFLLCAGYLVHWQEADSWKLLDKFLRI